MNPYGNFRANFIRTGGNWYIIWSQKYCSDCSKAGLLYVSATKIDRVRLEAHNYTDPVSSRFKGQTSSRFGGRYGFDVSYRLNGAEVCYDREANLKAWKAFFKTDKVVSFTLDAAEAGKDPWQMFIGHYEMLMMYFGPGIAQRILDDLKAGKIHLGQNPSGRNLAEEARNVLAAKPLE